MPRERNHSTLLGLRRLVHRALAVGGLLAVAMPGAASADQWYKTDTHVHSSAVSGDAPQDIGIISAAARAQGFNAVFLSDHTAAGTQPIGGVIANHLRLDDDLAQWQPDAYPEAGSKTSAAASPSQQNMAVNSNDTYLCELGGTQPSSASGTTAVGPNSTTNEMVSTPVNTGTQALHLASTNSAYGETFVWMKRGPDLHS